MQLHPILGFRLPESRRKAAPYALMPTTSRSFASAGGSGTLSPARRRPRGVLSQRRSRFLCGPRTGREASSRPHPRLHPDLRPRRIRRGKRSREMAAKAGAEFIPIPIRQDDLADHFADAILQSETFCFNAHGVAKYLLSRAVRDAGYKVVITGEGSDEILGGYAHFRRDMLLYNREGQDPAEVTACSHDLETLNPVSRGLLLPHGEARPLDNVRRLLGFIPSWIETFSARSPRCRHCWLRISSARFGDREGYHALLSDLDVRGQLDGPRSGASVTLPVVEDPAAQLHSDHAGRSHGNGALHRGPGAFPRSSCGGSNSLAASEPEDPRHDREVCAPGSGTRCDYRYRLPETETSILEPAGHAEPRRRSSTLWCRTRCAARCWHRFRSSIRRRS